ncbi:DegT/DnrJ/EryC1/StrS family aminotransferase [Pseudoalteromonas simplex]|uniref:DegT/DnrJ/EryC1/StrS family aminotransferase n=1 Tax=Pseudoalteromonas simplex TaxID=2783613 RepID=UPI001887D9FD|nr:DegT/DnrJ/EryC1/StrS family aminotransferase [Pseudoalteromonas sp. A520]|tara:strand:- start:8664 stop:9773 length:1110 start_codon:yes stop_codon:yes gene_type:complete
MDKITVTSPLLPPLKEVIPYLEDIWDRKWLTNNGIYHQQLEKKLCEYLGVPYISLFSNGTLALITALQSLELKGEVITTPYTFAATAHAIMWNDLKPVFVDIDPVTMNLDPSCIEAAITDNTCAILPVHVYGTPCDNQTIAAIAKKYDLKVIYDAAHAFGVKEREQSILNYGDLSILSFHATKTYSTIEGGAVICKSQEEKDKLDQLKNFGFESETVIKACGMNAKLNEIQAAFGLASLKKVDGAIERRSEIAALYQQSLVNVSGLSTLRINHEVSLNHSYFPIIIDVDKFGIDRDTLALKLEENNIFARRYFYPIVSEFEVFKSEYSDTPIAKDISNRVLCLPIHADLTLEQQQRVIDTILNSRGGKK